MNVNNIFVLFICLLSSFLELGSAAIAPYAKSFQKEVLDAHNYYRARHNTPPLQLDDKLSKYATEWAKYLLTSNRFEHRKNGVYGENLYKVIGGNLAATNAVRGWYNKIRNYSWNHPRFHNNTGHFTQVVWKKSKKLGVGFAKRGNTMVVVANYDPPGNYYNEFPQNVLPPK